MVVMAAGAVPTISGSVMVIGKKSLGQHWLNDTKTLKAICRAGEIKASDTVLEIGPGLGSLTKLLVKQAKQVVAVELDEDLIKNLTSQVSTENLQIINQDILKFDFDMLPAGYKVVANIPYYLTSHLLRRLSTAANPPSKMVLLVQKEVAQRLCAKPGQMSLLAVSTQLYYDCQLGQVVPAELFDPVPEVDSQVVTLDRHAQPLFNDLDEASLFRVVKAGFSERRKMLRSSLAGGLGISKQQAEDLLTEAGIDGSWRAQNLSLKQWHNLAQIAAKLNKS